MSGPEDDPLARLPPQPVPEPDPARRKANIAAARDEFARQQLHGRRSPAQASGWRKLWQQLGRPSGWMVPAGAGALALVAAVAVAPSILQPELGPSEIMPDSAAPTAPSIPARAPAASDSAAPAEAPPLQMGVRPPAGMRPTPIGTPLPAPASTEHYTVDGLDVGVRNLPEAVEVFVVEDESEHRVDFTIKDETETFTISDGFVHAGPDGTQLLLLRVGPEGRQGWQAFEREGENYVRLGQLSGVISDAANREQVVSRLQSVPQ